MKTAKDILKLFEDINEVSDLDAIRSEVSSSFSRKEMSGFKDFKAFFAAVDVLNGYESEWKPKKYEPLYKKIWDEYKAGKLKLED